VPAVSNPSAMMYPPQPAPLKQAEPEIATAVPVPDEPSSGYISKADHSAEPAVQSAPLPPSARMMAIVIPPGVQPGQVIGAQAPDGTVVQV
jgi:hypothetical protein